MSKPSAPRVLVAGVGNVLRGDDGFGIRLLERVRSGTLANEDRLRFWESGIAGIGLVHELMTGFGALLVLDALERDCEPGRLFVLEPDLDGYRRDRSSPVDIHEANPEGVFHLAAAMNVLPDRVWIIGAQAGSCDEVTTELTPAVEAALDPACQETERIVRDYLSETNAHVA